MSGNRRYETAGGVMVDEQIFDDGTILQVITSPDGETVTVSRTPDGQVETSDSAPVRVNPINTPQSETPQPLEFDTPTDENGNFKFELRSLEYPIVDAANKPKHFVRFFINLDEESKIIKNNVVESVDIDQSNQNRTRNVPSSEDRTAALIGGAAAIQTTSSVAGGLGRGSSVLKSLSKFKSRSAAIAGGALAGAATGLITAYAIKSNIIDVSKKIKRLKTSITMYMPAGIAANYRTDYEVTNDELAELLSGDKGQEIAQIIANESTTSAAAEISRGLTRIIATAASDTVQQLTRTALNKKVDVLFKKVNNRTFSFEFDFYPKTSEEAFRVAEIIYQFKLYSHPEIIDGLEQYLFVYPAEFDIEYGIRTDDGNERNNPFLNRISSCVLMGMSVNYGASGGSYQSLKNGEPIHTKLNLQFMEIETLHRGRIEAGL